jgi:hypothetical protein
MNLLTSRRLVWSALFLLIALNFFVGGMAYRYLGRIDASYTLLLNEGIPFLNNMQTATTQASRSYGLLVDLSEAGTPEEAAQLEADLVAVRAVSEQIFTSPLDEKAVPEELKAGYNEIRQMRKEGRGRVGAFLDLVHQRKLTEARAFLHHEIYPAHKAYLTKLDTFCDRYQDTFQALNRKLTDENARGRSLLFGLAAAPAVVLLALVVLAILGVVSVFALVVVPRFGSAHDNDPRN